MIKKVNQVFDFHIKTFDSINKSSMDFLKYKYFIEKNNYHKMLNEKNRIDKLY